MRQQPGAGAAPRVLWQRFAAAQRKMGYGGAIVSPLPSGQPRGTFQPPFGLDAEAAVSGEI